MATQKEMMMDAAANIETAATMSAGDTFQGMLSSNSDEDWIRIEMTAGMLYTINLKGADTDGVADTFLRLYDSKGGLIKMNDDIDGAKGKLDSSFGFVPEVSGTYYISAGAYTGNPVPDNKGAYTVTVTAVELDLTLGTEIEGTENADKLRGTDKSETLIGLEGDDSLFGLGGDDTLDGGAGNDLLVGGMGADTLMGGADEDTISYNVSPAGVTINLTDGTARGGDADGDTIVDNVAGGKIENVRGSSHADVLTGDRYINKLWGLGGNDELNGLRGHDKLYGGSGDDVLDGGRNNDTLEGGLGADVLIGGDGDDTASYESSTMGVTVRLHNSRFEGGDAKGDSFGRMVAVEYTVMDEDGDTMDHEGMLPDISNLTGSANADVLAGDMRNNTIMGGGGDDRIYGGPSPKGATGDGDDANKDALHGGAGNDMIFGGAGDDVLHGDGGDDMLVGGAGADTYYGGAGSDMIYADKDDTKIDGWIENPADDNDTDVDESDEADAANDPMAVDTVSFAREENDEERGIAATLGGSSTDSIASGAERYGGMTIDDVENIIGSQYDDTLTGDGGANVIEGGAGRDILSGGTGADDGNDTLSYASSDSWVRVTLRAAGEEADVSRGHARGDTATNFENVTGSAYDDNLTGNADDNVLKGGAGDDELEGMGGDDTLEGGAGADELHGGWTDSGSNGNGPNNEANTLSYAGSDAGVTVNLASATASGGHAEGDTIMTYEEAMATEDDLNNEIDVATFTNVTGSMHDDRLTGNHANNHLTGGAGDDTLRGGASHRVDGTTAGAMRGDMLVGGPGADMLDGGEDAGETNDEVPDTSDDAEEGAMNPASVDWAVYRDAMEGVTVNLATGMGEGGEAMGDTLRNIELVWGSRHDDTFIAGPGADNIEGDGGSDTVSYEVSEMGVTVDLSLDAAHRTVAATGAGTEAEPFIFTSDKDPAAITRPTDGVASIPEDTADGAPDVGDDNPETNGAADDILGSIENLTGSAHKDVLTGDENPNVLKGMGDDDRINGGAQNDKLYGGDGDDILGVSDIDNDGTDNPEGGDDMLMGGAGNDTLSGGAGNDTINGGGGDDDLSGGADGDTFVFSPMDGAGDSDAILDWAVGDKIDLSAFELTADQVVAAIELRGTGDGAYAVINLTEFGGGRITIDDLSDLDTLDSATNDTTTDANEESDGIIQTLSVYNDADGDGTIDTSDGTVETDGVFIL